MEKEPSLPDIPSFVPPLPETLMTAPEIASVPVA